MRCAPDLDSDARARNCRGQFGQRALPEATRGLLNEELPSPTKSLGYFLLGTHAHQIDVKYGTAMTNAVGNDSRTFAHSTVSVYYGPQSACPGTLQYLLQVRPRAKSIRSAVSARKIEIERIEDTHAYVYLTR